MSHLVKKNVKKMIEVDVEEISGVVLELTLEEATALQSLLGATNSTNRFVGINIGRIWHQLKGLGFENGPTPKNTETIDTERYFKDLKMEDCKYPGKKVK